MCYLYVAFFHIKFLTSNDNFRIFYNIQNIFRKYNVFPA